VSQVLRGSLILCLVALNYAVANALVKVLSTLTGFWQISLGRFAVGVLAVPLLALIMGLSLKGRQSGVILIRSVLGTLTFLAMIEAFSRAPLAEAMVLFYLYPVVGALVSPCLVGDRTRPGDWPCLGLGLLGTALILWRPGQAGLSLGAGHLLALLAALLCGVQLVLIRRLSRDNNPLTIYFYFCLVGGLACVPPLAGQSGPL
jgi:drug/metabolite transporter (DMT)-like permease